MTYNLLAIYFLIFLYFFNLYHIDYFKNFSSKIYPLFGIFNFLVFSIKKFYFGIYLAENDLFLAIISVFISITLGMIWFLTKNVFKILKFDKDQKKEDSIKEEILPSFLLRERKIHQIEAPKTEISNKNKDISNTDFLLMPPAGKISILEKVDKQNKEINEKINQIEENYNQKFNKLINDYERKIHKIEEEKNTKAEENIKNEILLYKEKTHSYIEELKQQFYNNEKIENIEKKIENINIELGLLIKDTQNFVDKIGNIIEITGTRNK